MTASVLAHLALSFSAHPENIATEALAFILRKSMDAQEALLGFLRQAGIHIEGPLTYRTQAVGTTAERPDLVAIDAKGKELLLIEAKFWAGLTENQPGNYLKRGTLLVVCPAKRVNFLWSELGRLCAADGQSLSNSRRVLALRDTWIAEVDTQKWLAITSWRELLSVIGSCLDRADDKTLRADVQQLDGLCERMDTEAFLPVSSEELTNGVYRRVIDFANLVDEVCEALVRDGLADLSNFRAATGIGWAGRWFYLSGAWCFLGCDLRKWLKLAATPLWLTVYGPKFKSRTPAEVRRILASLEAGNPTRLYLDDEDNYTVPLFVPINVERPAVLDELVKQAKKVAHLLKGFGSSTAASEGVVVAPDITEIPGDGDT